MPQPSDDPDDHDRRRNYHPPFGVEVEAFESKLTTHSVGQSSTASSVALRFRRNLLCYAARIAIPHPTTASAIIMQVAVKAFSMADEGIVMLSFAYPAELSMRFRRGPATTRSRL
jgi:hypothetical protein